jgi:DNA-binding transcriptional ArsR family regulator
MADDGQNAGKINVLDELAHSTYLTRKLRNDIFSPDLFGEPAWDILLLLFSNADHSGKLSVQDFSRELRLSDSLVTRWLAILADHDLVLLLSDRAELSNSGRNKLEYYLKRQIGALTQLLQSISASDSSGRGATKFVI